MSDEHSRKGGAMPETFGAEPPTTPVRRPSEPSLDKSLGEAAPLRRVATNVVHAYLSRPETQARLKALVARKLPASSAESPTKALVGARSNAVQRSFAQDEAMPPWLAAIVDRIVAEFEASRPTPTPPAQKALVAPIAAPSPDRNPKEAIEPPPGERETRSASRATVWLFVAAIGLALLVVFWWRRSHPHL